MTVNTKEFSAKQEKMVADFMGWKVVTGSGSRPFTPGDVNSYDFLVECKTHITAQDKIVFRKAHWKKISSEAMSKHRYPVLITDDGTQKAGNTWVMIPRRMLTSESSLGIFGSWWDKSRSDNLISLSTKTAPHLCNTVQAAPGIKFIYLAAQFDSEELAIMPLETFRQLCSEDFGV